MIYLVLAILTSSSISLGLTFAKEKSCNEINVTWFNYLMASVIGLGMMLSSGILKGAGTFSLAAFTECVKGNINANGSLTYSLMFGILTGAIYLAGFLTMQAAIKRDGPSPTAIFARLGIIIPILISIVLWNERPTMVRWFGIVVAFAALIAFNYDGKLKFDGLLFLVFLTSGVGELMNKFFTQWCITDYKPIFLFCIFFSAYILTTVMLFVRKDRAPMKVIEVVMGLIVGIFNMISSFFIIKSLEYLPSNLVYPVLCAGVILVIAFGGRIAFKEKLGRKGIIAVVLTIISLVLVNV